ncbi:cytochrome P450 4F4-like [Mytilus californianus]|uniref:cytochrome P450 4F4-like n=1 Tax=Mytilus californianus TaxID=6549 RepID=UPI0022471E95|nr:cytochrome P450 4F4-like [Mytilus californianus]
MWFHDLASYFKLLGKIVEKERPKVYVSWILFFYPIFGVCHPDSAQILYKSSAPKAFAVGGTYRYLRDWIGDGLLISDGKKWERNRRLLTPGFHFEILKPYVKVYNSVTDVFLEKLKVYAKSGEAIDIFPRVALATLETILRCAFSYRGNIQDQGSTEKKEGKPTKRHLDFLDILLTAKDDNGIGLSDEDVRAEVDTFLFEGHDTTASAISWTIYCLGKYTEEQEKVYTEISKLLVDKSEVTWENLQEMPRLTSFVKESMRMFAPVPVTARLLMSLMKFGDIVVPAGVHIDINIHSIHHHPDVWPEHEVFRPERFLQEDITDRHPYSYIHFAAGSRNCIGQNFAMNEIKVIISRLVQRYKVSLLDGHNYDINPELVMRATHGIKVILGNRHLGPSRGIEVKEKTIVWK